jgi:hypothetical protein
MTMANLITWMAGEPRLRAAATIKPIPKLPSVSVSPQPPRYR